VTPDPAAFSSIAPLADRTSLREQVAHALRAAVVAGELAPGEVYSAPGLAARFGVSVTPVREALLDLAKEGMVTAVRNKGYRVTALDESALDDIHQVRELLEVPAVAELVGRVTTADLRPLRAVAAEIEDCARSGDVVGYLDADRRFHLALLALTGNTLLVELVADLRTRTRLYGLTRLADDGGLLDSAREHVRLLTALGRGDRSAVERLVREHLRHTRGSWAGRPEEDGSTSHRRHEESP
jgi:DNA-binding GntR family transcriptional regulator